MEKQLLLCRRVNVILNLGGSGDEQGDRLIWSLGMINKVGCTFGLELS